ncbi:MAG TPA: presqualene diphosphate synthase HpnD [Kiloniellales bacterium]|nr:presqualene diphosphate synthase HpnD [Kiloniellales bacterium]
MTAGTAGETAGAQAHVDAVVGRSKTSFLAGMRILPRPRREAMYAIYAFCREVDDVADEPGPLPEKLRELALWRAEVEALFAGRPTRPTTRALLRPLADYRLPKAEFLAIIDGMEMDARGPIVAPDAATLALYCRRVAGAVGQLSIRVFGATGADAEALAIAEGEALQLTNILRDQAEDAADGRLYLPAEALAAAGIAERDPGAVLAHPQIGEARRLVGEQAQLRFAESRALIARLPRAAIKPAILMLEVYWRLFRLMQDRGWQQVLPRVRLSKPRKLLVLLRYGLI